MNFIITISIHVIVLITIGSEAGVTNYLNTKEHKCVACLCHVTTGCYSLQKCASVSVNYTKWQEAGSPTLNGNGAVNEASFNECIKDNNCIINTIWNYLLTHNTDDCYCDGTFDCRDMLGMHLYGNKCVNLKGSIRIGWYNECAREENLPTMDPNIECIGAEI